jgi:hypothetical protein
MQEDNNYETLLGKAQSSDTKTLLQAPDAYFETNASKIMALIKAETPFNATKDAPYDIPTNYFNTNRFIPTKKKSIVLQWTTLKWVAAASIVFFIGLQFFNKQSSKTNIDLSTITNEEMALYLQEHEWVHQSAIIDVPSLEQISEASIDELLNEQLNTL